VHALPAAGAELVAPNRWRRHITISNIRYSKTYLMNGLRLYTNNEVIETQGGYSVFYSRCEDGPYYRWSYNDNSREWHVCRVRPDVLSQRMLTSTPVKTVPAPLRRNLAEHYQLD